MIQSCKRYVYLPTLTSGPLVLTCSQHWDAFNMEQQGGKPAAHKKRSDHHNTGPLKPVFVHGTCHHSYAPRSLV